MKRTRWLLSVLAFGLAMSFALACGRSSTNSGVTHPAADDDNDISPSDDDISPAADDDDDDDDDFVWSQTSGEFPGLRSVWGTSHEDIFAVGTDWTAKTAAVLHFDGMSWSRMASGEGEFDLWSVAGTSPSDVFAVGEGNATVILHYDGASWSIMPAPVDLGFDLRGVWAGSASNVYAVGFDAKIEGVVGHFDGGSWSVVNGRFPSFLQAVWGTSPADVFVGGNGRISHFDGTTWSLMPGMNEDTGIVSLWGVSPSDVFATGGINSVNVIFQYDGSSWSAAYEGSFALLSGVWGTSHSDVFAVGGYQDASQACHDAILHYDGSTWSIMDGGTYPFVLLSGWGSTPADVFAVGYDYNSGAGVILHYGPPQ
jgi:hypothetical protein